MSRLSLRDSIILITLILLTFGLSFGISQYTAKKEIESICEHKLKQDLSYMLTYIDKELSQAELSAKTLASALFEDEDVLPDSNKVWSKMDRFLEVNPNISSVMVGFEDRVYPEYANDNGYGQIAVSSAKGNKHYLLQDIEDFRNFDWYSVALHSVSRRWCRPYFSPSGQYPISTYSTPIYNKRKHLMGVLGVSLRLSRFDSIMNNLKPFPNAVYTVVLNHNLTYIMHPIKDYTLNMDMKSELEALGEKVSDNFLSELGARHAGKEHVVWEGKEKTIYYAPVDKAECSVLLIIEDKTMYESIAPQQKMRVLFSAIGLGIIVIYLLLLVRHRRKKNPKK